MESFGYSYGKVLSWGIYFPTACAQPFPQPSLLRPISHNYTGIATATAVGLGDLQRSVCFLDTGITLLFTTIKTTLMSFLWFHCR